MSNKRTKWKKIGELSGCKKPAIYKIRIRKNGKKVSIPRFFKKDGEGLLCIGKSTKFENRRKAFKRGLENGKEHAEAMLLHLLKERKRLKKKFKNYTYEYSFKNLRKGLKLKEQESREIKRYVKEFGEVPPLNSAIPLRYDKKTWYG